ncbi:MAG TPA: T9SS type A sorting domain-containing protein, partial [Flavobacterium sp.]|nr:T9SS type A sorting domain-containing protein [Flavobacterium sp.]
EVFRCMAVRTDGRIILGGQTNTYLEANAEQGIGLVQLTTGGQLDNTYGTGGISIVETQWYDAIDIVLQADQKLLMAIGEAETGYPSARFLPNGSLDSGYGNNGIAIVPLTMQSYSGFITVLPDNKILLGGLTVDPNNENSACAFVMRLDPGTLSVNGNQANSVDIYPNPTTASAFFDNSKAAFSKAFVYNALGQDVSQIELQPFENQEINLAELSAGVYFVRLENDVYQQIFRLIKE